MDEKTLRLSNTHADLVDRDRKHVLGWRYSPSIVFRAGKGVTLIDVDGNEYYDLTSGMMCLALGHGHPELVETIKEQAELFVHESSWYSNPWLIEFAELLASTLPGNLSVVNFTVTGSEANEVAMRMALGVTGAYDMVSVVRGLHGGSLAVESLTTVGGARRRHLGPLMIPSRANAIFPPFCYRCPVNLEYPQCDVACLRSSEELMEYVTSKNVAAIITETMLVAGGMIVPPPEWLPRLKRVAEDWGALLIVDEAQLAPGRTGKLWGFEHYDVVPDIVTFAKGMSAGFSICGAVTTPEIAEHAKGTVGIPWAGTYSGDPLPAAVAKKQLEIVLRDNLAQQAERLGEFLRNRLEELHKKYEVIGDVRGKGLYQMLDVVKSRESRAPDPVMAERIRHNALVEGIVMICVKNYLRICPPLIITQGDLDEVVGRLELAIQRAIEGHPEQLELTESGSLA